MEKKYAAIALTLAICVLAIPVAYLMGQRSALEIAQRHYQDALARDRAAHAQAPSHEPSTTPAVTKPLPSDAQIARADAASTVLPEIDSHPVAQPPATIAPAPPDPGSPATTDTPDSVNGKVALASPITQAVFDAAAMGSTYEQIVREFGREGEPMMMLEDGAGIVTTQYVWDWLDSEGNAARIRMQFVDGRLIDKSFSD